MYASAALRAPLPAHLAVLLTLALCAAVPADNRVAAPPLLVAVRGCLWLDLDEPDPTQQSKQAGECLHISEGFTFAYVAGECLDTVSGSRVPAADCFGLRAGIGIGTYLQAHSTPHGMILTAVPSGRDFLGIGSPTAPPLGFFSAETGMDETEAVAEAAARAAVECCASVETLGICAAAAVQRECSCCEQAGGAGCSLSLDPLPAAAAAAAAHRASHMTLPVRDPRFYFRLFSLERDASGTRVWQGPLQQAEGGRRAGRAPREVRVVGWREEEDS